jgi:hypothetical protein
MNRAVADDSARNFEVTQNVPEALGWLRRAELDEGPRQAWELRDGSVLLLDPTGESDARLHRVHTEPVAPTGPFLRRSTDIRVSAAA